MRTVIWKELSEAERQEVLTRPAVSSKLDIVGIVTDIVDRIKKEKDQALLEFTAKLDHVTDGKIRLTAEEISEKCAAVPQALKDAIVHAKENISAFHEQQKTAPVVVHTQPGITCELHTHAIDNVGLYVPGGSAPLVSTVLMLAIPAQIAGCKRVIMCSPPPVANEIVYAAQLCGVQEIYTIGGAQAVAAMAYGTETVGKVDKIFGQPRRLHRYAGRSFRGTGNCRSQIKSGLCRLRSAVTGRTRSGLPGDPGYRRSGIQQTGGS